MKGSAPCSAFLYTQLLGTLSVAANSSTVSSRLCVASTSSNSFPVPAYQPVDNMTVKCCNLLSQRLRCYHLLTLVGEPVDMEAIGLFIAKERGARNLSQAALAKKAGISRPYMTQIETGKRMPSENTMDAVLAALGLTMLDVLRHFRDDADPEIRQALEIVEFLQLVQSRLTEEELATWGRLFSSEDDVRLWVDKLMPPPEAPPAPEGWSELQPNDRNLLQRLINRLLRDAKTADYGDE